MHIELVRFFCSKCATEIFMDSKTVKQRKDKTGKCMCDECFKKFILKGKK